MCVDSSYSSGIANKFYHHMSAYGVDKATQEGQAWYPNAWQLCKRLAAEHSLQPKRVAAVLAATSPRARWSTNVEATELLLADYVAGSKRGSYKILGANAAKGMKILESRYYYNVLSGPKVTAFYAAICGDEDAVTVDSIMSKAAGFSSNVSDAIREDVTNAVWQIGDVFGLSPRDAQAAVWCAFRGSAV